MVFFTIFKQELNIFNVDWAINFSLFAELCLGAKYEKLRGWGGRFGHEKNGSSVWMPLEGREAEGPGY